MLNIEKICPFNEKKAYFIWHCTRLVSRKFKTLKKKELIHIGANSPDVKGVLAH
jgi:hypothetical protein